MEAEIPQVLTDLRNLVDEVTEAFEVNVSSVYSLVNLDREVVDLCLKIMTDADAALAPHGVDNHLMRLTGGIQQLKNIRKNDSVRGRFEDMLNQCPVLLASYFSSAVGGLLRAGLPAAVAGMGRTEITKRDLKFSLAELVAAGDGPERVCEIIFARSSSSFQDMKSIKNAFQNFFGIDITRDETVDTIIIGMACRHVIVHNGSVVDSQCLRQVRDCGGHSLGVQLKLDKKVSFDEAAIRNLGSAMTKYLRQLSVELVAAFASTEGLHAQETFEG